jgi:hypothetical protein
MQSLSVARRAQRLILKTSLPEYFEYLLEMPQLLSSQSRHFIEKRDMIAIAVHQTKGR